jgi:naphthoate synthase
MVSELFDADAWEEVEGFGFTDITYHRAVDHGTVRVAFNRPDVRNAFRPHTVDELYRALDHARMSSDIGCVLLTGNGPSPRDGGWAFCSGGDQRIRGRDGYKYAEGETSASTAASGRRTWRGRWGRSSPARSSSWATPTMPRPPTAWAW